MGLSVVNAGGGILQTQLLGLRRFQAIQVSELPQLTCSVNILHSFEDARDSYAQGFASSKPICIIPSFLSQLVLLVPVRLANRAFYDVQTKRTGLQVFPYHMALADVKDEYVLVMRSLHQTVDFFCVCSSKMPCG